MRSDRGARVVDRMRYAQAIAKCGPEVVEDFERCLIEAARWEIGDDISGATGACYQVISDRGVRGQDVIEVKPFDRLGHMGPTLLFVIDADEHRACADDEDDWSEFAENLLTFEVDDPRLWTSAGLDERGRVWLRVSSRGRAKWSASNIPADPLAIAKAVCSYTAGLDVRR